jgi:hypothetical protein
MPMALSRGNLSAMITERQKEAAKKLAANIKISRRRASEVAREVKKLPDGSWDVDAMVDEFPSGLRDDIVKMVLRRDRAP